MLTSTQAEESTPAATIPVRTDQCRQTEAEIDDAELLAALRAGHEWAFEALVRVSGARLLAVARRFARNDQDAQDIVQSAYLNAFRALGQFEGGARLSTWLHRIVVNTALMKLRSQRRKPEESMEELLPSFQADGHHVERFSDWGASADELLERKETRATVRACIAQLPEEYRTVLLLRDIEEASTREAAKTLGLTQAAVKTRLHRARQALATLLRRKYAQAAVTSTVGPASQ